MNEYREFARTLKAPIAQALFCELFADGQSIEEIKEHFKEMDKPIGGPCSSCGGDHWHPDCPTIAEGIRAQQIRQMMQPKPIPKSLCCKATVYYGLYEDNLYCTKCRTGCGNDFWKVYHRIIDAFPIDKLAMELPYAK